MILSTLRAAQGRDFVVFRDIVMKHATQIQFGRSIEVVLPPEQSNTIDKWEALDALTDASESFELTHRSLGVLKALMTFLPGRLIHPMPGHAVVFPSNRTLSKRLNGMPESTLRRHLARLVSLGIVSRQDSPNRKRYARGAGDASIAFGFDLSPLARHSQNLITRAESAKAAHEATLALRCHVADLLHQLMGLQPTHALGDDTRRILRRKPDPAALEAISQQLAAALSDCELAEMSGTDIQNERHIQTEIKPFSDSEGRPHQAQSQTQSKGQKKQSPSDGKPISLQYVLDSCTEYQSYFPDRITSWHDLLHITDQLRDMLGIDPLVFMDAIKAMGHQQAATTILCLLENGDRIENHGGYLRRLTQVARAGGFRIKPMLQAARHRAQLPADNFDYCLETTG